MKSLIERWMENRGFEKKKEKEPKIVWTGWLTMRKLENSWLSMKSMLERWVENRGF